MDLKRFQEKAERLRVLNMIVMQDGKTIAELDFDDRARRNVYSASKSFTAMAVGMACREGKLDISEKLVDAFSKDLPEKVNENLAEATVRDLLTMCLGQDKAYLMGGQRPFLEETDWVRYSLALPFTDAPNAHFVYNNVGPYLAGVLIQRRYGMNLVEYLWPRLFEPLRIQKPTWEADPLGNTFGAGGLFLNVNELSRFGQLILQNGYWNGQQLVPAEWVTACTSRQVENDTDYGYGYLFWGGPKGSFRADGKYCQFAIVLRDKNAVITTVSECRDSESLLNAIFDELYPQL